MKSQTTASAKTKELQPTAQADKIPAHLLLLSPPKTYPLLKI